MDTQEVLKAVALVHADPALGVIDKVVATRIFLSMDALGECRLSKRALVRSERLHPQSVRQAIDRLCNRGWIIQVRLANNAYAYRPGQLIQSASQVNQVGQNSTPHRVKSDAPRPSGVGRMDMPRERAERLIAALTHLQRLYDAGSTSEMIAVTEEQKRLWLISSEQLQEDIDALARHLATYPGRGE